MIKVLFISDNKNYSQRLKNIFQGSSWSFSTISDEKYLTDELNAITPDVIIINQDFKNHDISKIIKSVKENTIIIYFVQTSKPDKDALKYANAFITDEMSDDLILSTVNINIRMKNSLDMLSNSNKDLADSLYRLNALYTTSSQFAGTLDKSKLFNYMIEGMDKALSFSLNCTLSLCDEPHLIIDSLYDLSDELLSAIKLRTILNYSSLYENPPEEITNLKVTKHIKYPANKFTFTMFQYDNLFAPIKLGDDIFGCVEIFKENPFTPDDAACFQTIAQQVALPLKSAILYEELTQTNEKLEKLQQLKSEFISIVSHELRTPLTSIKNSLTILKSGRCGEFADNAKEFLSMASRNVTRLSGIINDLLDLSKIEAGKMEFKFKPANINNVIDYVKSALSQDAKIKGLTLTAEKCENLPEIQADAQRIEQVLTNLVSNAIKFTPEGKHVKISSTLVNAKDITINDYFKDQIQNLNGDYIMVCVQDEGIGIAQKDLLRAFDKFAQIENSLARKVGGTGLGLPIAKQMLDAHKGAIWCDSELGIGSTFKFILPVVKETVTV